eukprot:2609161-Amphidinium_carterae.2
MTWPATAAVMVRQNANAPARDVVVSLQSGLPEEYRRTVFPGVRPQTIINRSVTSDLGRELTEEL